MQAWKKKKSLMRGVKFTAVFEPMEREVLGDLTSTVSEAIIARAQSAPKDELADMLDMPTDLETGIKKGGDVPDSIAACDAEISG